MQCPKCGGEDLIGHGRAGSGNQRYQCKGCGFRTTQPAGVDRSVPDGFRLQGVSTLYDSQTGEPKIEWHKISADKERQEELFRIVLDEMAQKLPRADPQPAPKGTTSEKMACYPVGDHHIGMLSWHEETGADYDLAIAEELLGRAMTHLASITPACDRAVLPFMGDLMHYDSFESVTPAHKNLLDADGRYPKMVRTTVRCVRRAIDTLLTRHKEVLVIFEPGNHDPSSTIFMMEMLAALYENEPRVIVDVTPRNVHYFSFGKCLVGTTHGDKKIKMSDLPLIMATDKPKEWGESDHRYFWTGHVHHDQVKDYHGCKVESMRVLAPMDAHAASSGYRSMPAMQAIVLHHEFGEVDRHTVSPSMLNHASK